MEDVNDGDPTSFDDKDYRTETEILIQIEYNDLGKGQSEKRMRISLHNCFGSDV